MSLFRPLNRALLFVLFALSLGSAHGQTASLVRDLNTFGFSTSAPPTALHVAGGKLFMRGGPGVWVSDGTSSGTVLLAAIFWSPGFLGNLGDTVFWAAEGEHGDQLWRSDGTREGTYPLSGPGTSVKSVNIRALYEERAHVFFRGALYFRGCDGFDCVTWRTDGTVEGTVETALPLFFDPTVVGDLLFFLGLGDSFSYELRVTGDPSAGSTLLAVLEPFPRPAAFTAAGNRLFFFAHSDGDELWSSDGTVAGTRAVTGFTPDEPFGEYDRVIGAAGNLVWFAADDVVHGREIWVSDGTPQGTRRATEFGYNEPMASSPGTMEEINGRLVFFATDGIRPAWLWTTRGTPESTASLPSCPSCSLANGTRLVKTGSKLVFVAEDADHGTELWATDGTPAGTGLVADICPGRCSSLWNARILPWPGGALLIGADDLTHEREIWFSDGTSAGTRRITDLESFGLDAYDPLPVSFAGQVWFAARKNIGGGGLWTTDGTPESTRMVAHMGLTEPSSEPDFLTPVGNRLWFLATDNTGRKPWSTLGTPESTVPVQAPSLPANGTFEGLTAAGGLVYFRTPGSVGQEQLWRTDGTPAGTFPVSSDSRPFEVGVALQDRLIFTAWNEIWASDGTAQGTGPFFTYPKDQPLSLPAAAGGALYFLALDEQNNTEVWRSDGTAAGTLKLRTIEDFSVFSGPTEFTASGSLVYFQRDDRIWKTDGTPQGTVAVLDGSDAYRASDLTAFQGGLAFFGISQGHGRALWRTDGTAAGTVRLRAFPPTPTSFAGETVDDLTAFAGRLFFVADDGEHGFELWTSDGTAAGTVLLRDLYPGPRSSLPFHLLVAGGRLFFTAVDPAHGRELWMSDGTAAGTRMVQDLNPYAYSSDPDQLTVAGDRLYFIADDGIAGRELWTLPLAAGPGCQPTAARLCLNGGRFQAEAAWKDFQGNRGTGQAVALTADTGYFWFFSPSNVEAVLKVLDGRGLNNHFWTFYGALSSVEYHLTVTDTQTGAAKRYFNPPGQLASVGDTNGFGPLGAYSVKGAASLTLIDSRTAPITGPCLPTSERLCLNGGRFAVEADWKDFQGKTGTGKATVLTNDTGWFWFFGPANVEVMIKVLDGTPLNGKHWVFYGALSSVEYTLTVTDTQTGVQRIYRNPSGTLGSVADTGAF